MKNHIPICATLAEAKEQLEKIEALSSDPEAAHALEADLWEGVLRAIASGKVCRENAAELAKMALKSKKIEFPMWCA